MADAGAVDQDRQQSTRGGASERSGARQPAPGAGVSAVQAVRGTGPAAVDQVAKILATYPGERDEIVAWLHKHRGNAFVTQVEDAAAKPGLPDGMELKSVSASVTIPGKRKLAGDLAASTSTRSATRVTLEVSTKGIALRFGPSMFIDATWPLQNADLHGAGLSFATGKATCDVEDGSGLGSGMISIKGKVADQITKALEDGVAGTPLARPGYDPTHDPDAAGTLATLQAKIQALFEGGAGDGGGIAPREMSNVSASATVSAKKGVSFVKDGTGLQLAAGSDLTLAAQGAGSVADLMDAKSAQGAATAANLQRLQLASQGLTVVSKGAPIVKIEALSILPGGQVTIDHMQLLGKAAEYQAGESGIALLVALIAIAGRDERTASGALQHAQNPTIVPGLTKSMIEKQFTQTVHDLVLAHRHDLPGMDLAAILKIQ